MTEPTDTAANDLDVLYPERVAVIAGRQVTMREYSFVESLQHAAPIAGLTDAMVGVALAGNFHDLDSLRNAFGSQWASVIDLIALACDQPASWVSSLGAQDGEQLFLLWWSVNADFFLRRVLLGVQLRKVREAGGPTFTPPSSPLDTAPATSAGTRTVN